MVVQNGDLPFYKVKKHLKQIPVNLSSEHTWHPIRIWKIHTERMKMLFHDCSTSPTEKRVY